MSTISTSCLCTLGYGSLYGWTVGALLYVFVKQGTYYAKTNTWHLILHNKSILILRISTTLTPKFPHPISLKFL